MTPAELLKLVTRAGRPGHDRPIGQVPPDVFGEVRRRRIPPVFIFLQRLRNDSFDVASVEALNRTKRSRVCVANRLYRVMELRTADVVGQIPGQQFIQNYT